MDYSIIYKQIVRAISRNNRLEEIDLGIFLPLQKDFSFKQVEDSRER